MQRSHYQTTAVSGFSGPVAKVQSNINGLNTHIRP